tara:strand:+ start:388 stop:597 length:210 start_codon:yes stop_codon:yes gene_type:complete
MSIKPLCKQCGKTYSHKRKSVGYNICMACGDRLAKTKKHTIVPMHKSNYIVVTDLEILKGINNKGGKHD